MNSDEITSAIATCGCPLCVEMRRCHTAAEKLITLADAVLSDKGITLVEFGRSYEQESETIARVKVALDFKKRGSCFFLRACVEEWPYSRIFRELY